MIGARDVLIAARRDVSGASAAIFRIGFGAVGALLVARPLHLNHYYWMVNTAAVMAFLPLHHRFSLDVRQSRRRRHRCRRPLSFNGRASTRFTDPETPIWPRTSETRAWLLSEPSG